VNRAPVRRWPLTLIAAPASVAIWSGWVTLGGLCGFGDVEPFPGIARWHLNTAITLPIGIESYAAFALGVWLSPQTTGRARRFARWSALGALVLGMLGQISYHLLAAEHATRAPDVVVVLVACLPVVVLGCAVGLMHLLSAEPGTPPGTPAPAVPETAPAVPEPVPGAPEIWRSMAANEHATGWDEPVPAVPEPPAALNGHGHEALRIYGPDAALGRVPSIRNIRERMHVGQDKAQQVQDWLRTQVPNP